MATPNFMMLGDERAAVTVDGKFFRTGADRFQFRAIDTRGCGGDTQPFDPAGAVAGGFTVMVTAWPSQPSIERAAFQGLRTLVAAELDWRALVAATRRSRLHAVESVGARLAHAATGGNVLGVALGRPPAPLQRSAPGAVARLAGQVAAAVRDVCPEWLVTMTASSHQWLRCPDEIDFLTVQMEGSDLVAVRAALSAAHRQVGDRPLVLAGLAPAGDGADRVLDLALERGVAGTVSAHPPAGPSQLGASAEQNRRTVADLDVRWPSVSVVVCAYNAADTLDQCLTHCDALAYPDFEVVVVDDGSTDDTAAIAGRHPGARLVPVPHGGLSAARNAGYRGASRDLIAYLDADAYPSPEWLWYLALAATGTAGSGGPNVPPPDDGVAASVVSHSPGGPIPQLVGEERAAHVPGCNMAFWRHVLDTLDGFDIELRSAEDLDFEWRLLQHGWEIGYHPAALVWHHRRPGRGAYLRQQRSYGRGQAQLERRRPERFPAGRRWKQLGAAVRRSADRSDHPPILPVAYSTLRSSEQPTLDLAHQWLVPIAAGLLLISPLGLVTPMLAVPGFVGGALVAVVFVIDLRHAPPPRLSRSASVQFRAAVAVNHILRPLAFQWGKSHEQLALRRRSPQWTPPPRSAAAAQEGA